MGEWGARQNDHSPGGAILVSDNDHNHGVLARLWAVARLRCPRCLRGRAFRTLLRMNDPCPECGLIFQREEGYFLGALYVSYALGVAVISAAFCATWLLLGEAPSFRVCLVLLAGYLPLMPFIYRYSRVIWMHLDRLASPGDTDAGAYEKLRLRHQGPVRD
jgi:uncharacterized protein (DUF983 family)